MVWGAAESQKQLPAPAPVVFASLAHPGGAADREWLTLRPDEQTPEVLCGVADRFLLWSTLWPELPEVQVQLDLTPDPRDRLCTQVRWTLLLAAPLPRDTIDRLSRRLDQLINHELRHTYGS